MATSAVHAAFAGAEFVFEGVFGDAGLAFLGAASGEKATKRKWTVTLTTFLALIYIQLYEINYIQSC